MKKVAFLNGGDGYGSAIEQEFAERLTLQGLETILIDGLYERPAKLRRIIGYDTLVLSTMGKRIKDIRKLFETFHSIDGYRPDNVIFAIDEEAFRGYGSIYPMIKFYQLDNLDFSLIPIIFTNPTNTKVEASNPAITDGNDETGNSDLA